MFRRGRLVLEIATFLEEAKRSCTVFVQTAELDILVWLLSCWRIRLTKNRSRPVL